VPNVLKIVADTLKTSEAAVEIEIENYENFVAFQFDLTFPAGVVPDLQNVALTADRKQNHSVSASAVSANTLRVVAFSLTQQNFLGNSGAIVKIPFTTNCGNYNFSLSNVLISNSLSENILQTSENGAVEIEQDTVTIYAAVCYGDVYTANGFSLPAQTESGVYLLDLQTANGCDSIVKLDLTVSINETVAAFASQIAALQNQVAALKADTVVYLSQISGLQTDTTALHSQISGLQTDTIALHSQIAVLTDNLNDCNENTTLLQNQVIALQTDTTAYLAQIALLQNQIIALKIDTTAYLAQIASLNTQITNLNTQITALQTDTAAYLAQIASLNTQITNLNTQITALQTDTAAYLAQIAGLNTQVATLQTQITSLNGQITNLQNDLGDCNSEKTALVNQITNLNTEISTLENQVLILENDLTDCNNEKTVLISDLQICTENAVILNEKIDSLQNELDNCKNQLGIEEIPAFEVQIYPNPATDELRIKSVDCQINSVEIFDISGRAVGAGRALPLQNGGQTINVSSLPAGVYLIKINTDKGTKTERFIKK
jgi:chromosome segregation ATPase